MIGPRRRPLTSFISGASDGVLNDGSPLAARGGLLLVNVAGDPETYSVRMAVCDPLTGSCDVLPPLSCSSVVLSREDCCPAQEARTLSMGYKTFFKVLAIVRGKHDRDCNIRTFSSSQSSWSAPRKCVLDRS